LSGGYSNQNNVRAVKDMRDFAAAGLKKA